MNKFVISKSVLLPNTHIILEDGDIIGVLDPDEYDDYDVVDSEVYEPIDIEDSEDLFTPDEMNTVLSDEPVELYPDEEISDEIEPIVEPMADEPEYNNIADVINNGGYVIEDPEEDLTVTPDEFPGAEENIQLN